MNNSNSRDVQDLIAEFVSSKNHLLHEEIISTIKLESFTNTQPDEVSQNGTAAQLLTPLCKSPSKISGN